MTSRKSSEIQIISSVFKNLYDDSLQDKIISNTKGLFQTFLVLLSSDLSDESNFVDQDKANQVKITIYFLIK